jgi:hypothetical protein
MPPSPTPYAARRDGRSSPTVSVVVPARNEAPNIGLVLGGLPPVDEVIVVDGGSSDRTVEAARAARPDAVVLRQTRSGKGNAVACGLAASRGDIVVTLNADGSTDPGEIPRLVAALMAGAEVAHASRYATGGRDLSGGRLERFGNAVLSRIVNGLYGSRFTDLGSGYNAYWRALLPGLDLPGPRVPGLRRGQLTRGDGPEIEPLVNIRMAVLGLHIVEVASVGYPTIHGDDRRRVLSRAWRALRTLLAEYLRGRRVATTVPSRPIGERTTGRHALPDGPAPAPQRRAYPGPRPAWAPTAGHRLDDGRAAGHVYGNHRAEPADSGVHRSALYDTGVRRVGVYDTGVHRTEIYDTGAHHLPDEDDNPLYRQGALRDVGGGRRRLDATDRRADGRPDLHLIAGEGGDDERRSDGRRGHLRALPGERFTR